MIARLLMCSQQEVRACLLRLAELGLVDVATGAMTEAGMVEAARLRQQRSPSAAHRDGLNVPRAA